MRWALYAPFTLKPSSTPGLYIMEVIFEVIGRCDRIVMRGEDTRVVSESSLEGNSINLYFA